MTRPIETARWLAVCLIAAVAIGVLVLVQATGSNARTFGETAWNLSQPTMIVKTAETAAELNQRLLDSDRRGRVVVFLSRFLHFVPAADTIPDRHDHFPIPVIDLVSVYGTGVEPKTVLWVILQEGIAREVVHVLPQQEYERRRAEIGVSTPEITLRSDSIVTNELGSRRVVRADPPELREPAILGIDAAYFDEAEVGPTLSMLRSSGLRSDFVILNFSHDNPDVTDRGRQRLSLLVTSLMGGD